MKVICVPRPSELRRKQSTMDEQQKKRLMKLAKLTGKAIFFIAVPAALSATNVSVATASAVFTLQEALNVPELSSNALSVSTTLATTAGQNPWKPLLALAERTYNFFLLLGNLLICGKGMVDAGECGANGNMRGIIKVIVRTVAIMAAFNMLPYIVFETKGAFDAFQVDWSEF